MARNDTRLQGRYVPIALATGMFLLIVVAVLQGASGPSQATVVSPAQYTSSSPSPLSNPAVIGGIVVAIFVAFLLLLLLLRRKRGGSALSTGGEAEADAGAAAGGATAGAGGASAWDEEHPDAEAEGSTSPSESDSDLDSTLGELDDLAKTAGTSSGDGVD